MREIRRQMEGLIRVGNMSEAADAKAQMAMMATDIEWLQFRIRNVREQEHDNSNDVPQGLCYINDILGANRTRLGTIHSVMKGVLMGVCQRYLEAELSNDVHRSRLFSGSIKEHARELQWLEYRIWILSNSR